MLQFLIDKFNTIEKKCIHRLIHAIDKVNIRKDKKEKKDKKGKKDKKRKSKKDFAVKTTLK